MLTASWDLILATLRHFAGSKPKTAKTLGISLKTLYNRIREYRVESAVRTAQTDPTVPSAGLFHFAQPWLVRVRQDELA